MQTLGKCSFLGGGGKMLASKDTFKNELLLFTLLQTYSQTISINSSCDWYNKILMPAAHISSSC